MTAIIESPCAILF